ncbi:MAG: hypothetical protein GKR94_06430 [Gammaproteobacteria bacterium]|nr:hypothetical protein [Gammaproteobacteria bacterium]
MYPATLKKKLIAVLEQIQIDSGLECSRLDGAVKPVEGIPQFDSKVWPVATTILAVEVGVAIPNNMNIFVDEVTKLPRSIDEIVVAISSLMQNTEKEVATP